MTVTVGRQQKMMVTWLQVRFYLREKIAAFILIMTNVLNLTALLCNIYPLLWNTEINKDNIAHTHTGFYNLRPYNCVICTKIKKIEVLNTHLENVAECWWWQMLYITAAVSTREIPTTSWIRLPAESLHNWPDSTGFRFHVMKEINQIQVQMWCVCCSLVRMRCFKCSIEIKHLIIFKNWWLILYICTFVRTHSVNTERLLRTLCNKTMSSGVWLNQVLTELSGGVGGWWRACSILGPNGLTGTRCRVWSVLRWHWFSVASPPAFPGLSITCGKHGSSILRLIISGLSTHTWWAPFWF